jgi:hypothetical protein
MLSQKPSPQTKTNLNQTIKESVTPSGGLMVKETIIESYTPSGNILHKEMIKETSMASGNIINKETTINDQSQTTPIFAPLPPEPTLWQKIKSFVLKYSIILGIICFLFPSVGLFIVTFIYKRTRSAMSQIVEGIENFKEEEPHNKKDLLNNLSKAMDKSAKKLVKKLK